MKTYQILDGDDSVGFIRTDDISKSDALTRLLNCEFGGKKGGYKRHYTTPDGRICATMDDYFYTFFYKLVYVDKYVDKE